MYILLFINQNAAGERYGKIIPVHWISYRNGTAGSYFYYYIADKAALQYIQAFEKDVVICYLIDSIEYRSYCRHFSFNVSVRKPEFTY